MNKLLRLRNKIGTRLYWILFSRGKLFPVAAELIRCKCGSGFQASSYRGQGNSHVLDFTKNKMYKRYRCMDCGKIRYYVEYQLKNKPRFKK